ncbi:MAG: flagellar biosynthetic protein FliO [Bdellovibrio sp.]|nr:flagellar biosynthetic protein FliO [Bdellovibrio sp.]
MKKLGLIFLSCLCLSLTTFASEETTLGSDISGTAAATEPANTLQVQKDEAKVITVSKPENQIPLNIDQVKKTADAGPMSSRLLMTFVIVAALLGSAYYFVKKYKISNTINKSNMQIKVLSQHYLGPKKSLAIVRVAGESILIGVTDSNISMIKSLSLLDDEVPTDVAMPQNFSDAMNVEDSKAMTSTAAAKTKISAAAQAQAAGQYNSAGQTGGVTGMNVDELEEEFSFSGLKDSVSKKLKSMRSI